MIVHNSFRKGDCCTPDIYYLEVHKLKTSVKNMKMRYENVV